MMEITIKGEAKEIAELVLALQTRRVEIPANEIAEKLELVTERKDSCFLQCMKDGIF